jgi:hypothetical protein
VYDDVLQVREGQGARKQPYVAAIASVGSQRMYVVLCMRLLIYEVVVADGRDTEFQR